MQWTKKTVITLVLLYFLFPHGRVRAATSAWREFGAAGNSDFTIDAVPPRLFHQTEDAAASIGSWYDDNWYQLGRGFDGTMTSLTLEGAVSHPEYFSSHISLSEFNDANYTRLNRSYVISDNAPFAFGEFKKVTFPNLNIPIDVNKYYRLDTIQDYQNRSVILKGTNATGAAAWTAMWNEFVYGTGRVEHRYRFYPYISASAIPREPVVIVPGVMGSKLKRASDGTEVWPSAAKMLFSGSDSYLDDLKLSPSGGATTVLATGDILRKEFLIFPFYENLIRSLKDGGYEEGRTLFVAPYDWRASIASSASEIAPALQNARNRSPDGKINVIAHSMGGLLMKKYLENAAATAVAAAATVATTTTAATATTSFINKLILAGVPQLGAPKTFKLLNYGDDLGLNWFSVGLNQNETKAIAENMPGIYDLLPSRRYVEVNGGYVKDFRNGRTRVLNYDEAGALVPNSSMFSAAGAFHAALDNNQFRASTSSVYNILGCTAGTLGEIRIYDGGKYGIGAVNGDGTVPITSAFNLSSGYHTFFAPGNDHMGLVQGQAPLNLIMDILNDRLTSLPSGISQSLADCFPQSPSSEKVLVSVGNSAELHVYDAENRHTGPNHASDTIETNIPGSSYHMVGQSDFAILRASGAYRVVAQAVASGTIDLQTERLNNFTPTKKTTYLSVPIPNSQTKVELNISDASTSAGTSPALKVDGGVATAPVFYKPTATLTASTSADIVPPVLTMPALPAAAVLHATTTFIFSAVDAGSGIASVKATLNGAEITSGQVIALTQPGINTFRLMAKDNAGNPSVNEETFTVVTTTPALLWPTARACVEKRLGQN